MLNFDSWQRCEMVRSLLRWALPDDGAGILDVGGYPGRMRSIMPEHNWMICDPKVDAPGNQIKGSADTLPFKDDAFDFCVSLDVLEHIEPSKREAVIKEMGRVARQGVVLTFPHNHTLVKAAEESVRHAYQLLYKKEHPWLSEHKQYALPDANTIHEFLMAVGGQSAIFDLGALRRWVHLQLIDLMLEATPNSLDLGKKLDEWYQEKLFLFEFNPPAYRKVILHLFNVDEPLGLDLIHPPLEEEVEADNAFFHEFTIGLLKLMLEQQSSSDDKMKQIQELEAQAQQARKAEAENTPTPTPPPPETPAPSSESTEYIMRLEQSLRSWEETYALTIEQLSETSQWRDQLEQRRSFRLYKRAMGLFGRKFE